MRKRCDYSDVDDINSSNILSNNNYQASYQKLRKKKNDIYFCQVRVKSRR